MVHLCLPHGAGSPLLDVVTLALLLGNTGSKELSVISSSILSGLGPPPLESDPVALVLEALRSDKPLDLGSLGVWLLLSVLWLNFTAHNEFSDIVLLGQSEESPDLGSPLWSQPVGEVDVGQTWKVILTLLDNDERQDSEVHADNTPPDRLPLSLTSTPWSIARVSLRQQEPDTGWVHDTLLHWETLLVVSSGDFEDVSLELITNGVTWNLLTHTLLDENT